MNRRLLAAVGLGAAALGCGAALTATAGWLIVQAASHPPVLTMLVAIVGVRAFGIARPALRYAERLVGHDAALRGLADLRTKVYTDLIPLTPARLGAHRRGELLAGVVDDVDAHVDRQLRVVAPAAVALVVAVAAVVGTSTLLPAAGWVLAAALVLGGVVGPALVLSVAARTEPEYVEARADLTRRVTDVLEAAPELVAGGALADYLDQVDSAHARVEGASRRSARAVAAAQALWVFAAGAGAAGVLAVGAPALAAGELTAPLLALLTLLPLGLADVLTPLPEAAALLVRSGRARRRLHRLARTEPAVTDPATPLPQFALTLREMPESRASSERRGPHLRLHGVTAAWSSAGTTVVGPVDLDLPPGRRVGVVGESGSGKSTLVALLTRALDPRAGAITLDGIDLRDLALADLHGVVGLVDDDPHLFGTTLVENVRLARPDADDDAVEAAMRAARLGPWLDMLPEGLQTRVGDGGVDVSGGERARIALARALLGDHPVLVLDEPTAHLDSGTAAAVLADLLAASSGRTVVLVGHRREGFVDLDEVLELTAGVGDTTVNFRRGETLSPSVL